MQNVWELIPMRNRIFWTWPARVLWRPCPKVGPHVFMRLVVPGIIIRHPRAPLLGNTPLTQFTEDLWSRLEPATRGKWALVCVLILHICFIAVLFKWDYDTADYILVCLFSYPIFIFYLQFCLYGDVFFLKL